MLSLYFYVNYFEFSFYESGIGQLGGHSIIVFVYLWICVFTRALAGTGWTVYLILLASHIWPRPADVP